MRSPERLNDLSTLLYSAHVQLIARGNNINWLYALGFMSRLRVIKIIKEQIQWQSQRLLFFQCTAYSYGPQP